MSGFPSRSAPADPAIAIGQAVPLIGTPRSGAFLPVDTIVARSSYPALAALYPATPAYFATRAVTVSGDRSGIASDGTTIVMAPNSASANVIVSFDAGFSWQTAALPLSSGVWRGLICGDGVFVLARFGTTFGAASPNGSTWAQVTLPSASNWLNGIHGGGVFVMLANGGNLCARSTNGTTWTSGTLPSSGAWNIGMWDAVRSRFFAHTTAATFAAAYSTDGTTWTSLTASGVPGVLSAMVLPSGRYVVTGNTSAYATSDDGGASWTARTLPVSAAGTWRCLSSADGGRAIVQHGSATVLSTEDGVSWTTSYMPSAAATWSPIASVPGQPYAMVTTGTSLQPVFFVYPARVGGSSIALRGPAGYHVRVR